MCNETPFWLENEKFCVIGLWQVTVPPHTPSFLLMDQAGAVRVESMLPYPWPLLKHAYLAFKADTKLQKSHRHFIVSILKLFFPFPEQIQCSQWE